MTGPPVPPTSETLADLSTDGYYALATTPGMAAWEDKLSGFEKLRDVSGELITTMESELDKLGSNWSGGSGAAFVEHCETILGALQEFHSAAGANCDGMRDIRDQMSSLREEADLLIDEDDGWCDNLDNDDESTVDSMREDLRKELRDKVIDAYESMAATASGYFLSPPEPVDHTLAGRTVDTSPVAKVSVDAQQFEMSADASSAEPTSVSSEDGADAPADTQVPGGTSTADATADGTVDKENAESDTQTGGTESGGTEGPMLQSAPAEASHAPADTAEHDSDGATGAPTLQSAASLDPATEHLHPDAAGSLRGTGTPSSPSGTMAPSAAGLGGAGHVPGPSQPTPDDDYVDTLAYDDSADESADTAEYDGEDQDDSAHSEDATGDDGEDQTDDSSHAHETVSADQGEDPDEKPRMDPFGTGLDMSVGDGSPPEDLPARDEPGLEKPEPTGPAGIGGDLPGETGSGLDELGDGQSGSGFDGPGDGPSGSGFDGPGAGQSGPNGPGAGGSLGSRLDAALGAGLGTSSLGGAALPDAGGPGMQRPPDGSDGSDDPESQEETRRARALREAHRG